MVRTASLDFEYDSNSKRFRYTQGASKGQFLSRDASLSIVNRNIDRVKENMVSLVDKLYDKKIDLDVFIIRQADYIKELHILSGIMGAGGTDKLNDSRLKQINSIIRQQYNGRDPDTGERFGLKYILRELNSEGETREKMRSRIAHYSESGNLSRQLVNQDIKKELGATEAKRSLRGDKHCPSCIRYSTGIWAKLEDVVLPGFNCECAGRCKCIIEYR